MASFNKVILMGNLTRDPNLRYTPSGRAVCEFSLAINRRFTVNGQEREEVCYVDIVVWGRIAETSGKFLSKGKNAMVEGRLTQDTWQDKDGKSRSRLRVTADVVQFLSPRTQSDANAPQQNYNEQSSYGQATYKDNYSAPRNNKPVQNSNPMPEPPVETFAGDFETEDDIPF